MEEHTKKLLVYGGGAASILAVILYLKNKSSSQAAAGYAPSTGGTSSGAGGSNDAAIAAAINSQTAQGIEASKEANAIAIATLQSQTNLGIAGLQTDAAKSIANTQASTQKTAVWVGALGGGAGAAFTQKFFDFLGSIVKGIFNPNQPVASNLGFVGSADEPVPIAGENAGWVAPGSTYSTPGVYSYGGNFQGVGFPSNPTAAPSDYFQGNTGSGDSAYFGTSPGENTPLPVDYVPPAGDTGGLPVGGLGET